LSAARLLSRAPAIANGSLVQWCSQFYATIRYESRV